jgi:rod shape-determining protein MreD
VRAWRVAVGGLLLLVLVPLQFAVINRIPLPGTGPDLVLVAVAAVGLYGGSQAGLIMGFAAGLCSDLAPPADHALGRLALAYALAGFVAGLFSDDAIHSTLAPIVVVGIAAIVAVGTFVIVGALLGDVRITWLALAHGVPSTVLYDVLLSPFVVPLVGAVLSRLEPEPTRRLT